MSVGQIFQLAKGPGRSYNSANATMKKVRYNGEPMNLSRFGSVSKGQVLDLYENEWLDVEEDKRFKLLTPLPSKEERGLASRVKPLWTDAYDLREIVWSAPNLYSVLLTRHSERHILLMIEAINIVGGYIQTPSGTEHKAVLADIVFAAAKFMGWDKLTPDEVKALPAFDPENKTEPVRQRSRPVATTN